MKTNANHLRKRFITVLVGMGAVALCCFTPILVVSLGIVGLSAMTPYLDYVLLPALVILILVTIFSYQKWRGTQK